MRTIQRHYDGQEKALDQQHPTRLMAEVESREVASKHSSWVGFRGVSPLAIDIHKGREYGHFSTGATGVVQLFDDDYSTGGPAVVQNAATGSVFKPESVSQDEGFWLRWCETTKELLLQSQTFSEPTTSVAAKLRVDRLSTIQAALGLPAQTLADVLRVSRPGLYKWLDASQDIAMRPDNIQRLAIVDDLAKQWRNLTHSPMSSVAYEPLLAGCTVLDLLKFEAIDVDAVIAAFSELVDKLHSKPKTLSQKMAEAGFKRRPSLSSLPADE